MAQWLVGPGGCGLGLFIFQGLPHGGCCEKLAPQSLVHKEEETLNPRRPQHSRHLLGPDAGS